LDKPRLNPLAPTDFFGRGIIDIVVVVRWYLGVYKEGDSAISLYIIVVGLCLVDLFPISISHQNRFLAVDQIYGKKGYIYIPR
jgi:hypothetical protein